MDLSFCQKDRQPKTKYHRNKRKPWRNRTRVKSMCSPNSIRRQWLKRRMMRVSEDRHLATAKMNWFQIRQSDLYLEISGRPPISNWIWMTRCWLKASLIKVITRQQRRSRERKAIPSHNWSINSKPSWNKLILQSRLSRPPINLFNWIMFRSIKLLLNRKKFTIRASVTLRTSNLNKPRPNCQVSSKSKVATERTQNNWNRLPMTTEPWKGRLKTSNSSWTSYLKIKGKSTIFRTNTMSKFRANSKRKRCSRNRRTSCRKWNKCKRRFKLSSRKYNSW